jgi:hypothetical protein
LWWGNGATGNLDLTQTFFSKQFGKLQKEFSLRAQALVTSLSLVFLSQHDPTIHKYLLHHLIFKRVGEYFRATHALAPFSPTPMSLDTTLVLTTYTMN